MTPIRRITVDYDTCFPGSDVVLAMRVNCNPQMFPNNEARKAFSDELEKAVSEAVALFEMRNR